MSIMRYMCMRGTKLDQPLNPDHSLGDQAVNNSLILSALCSRCSRLAVETQS